MRYIQSYELREWVKDNLRKTIFQKAHALAVQTGCEVLVKLHDNADVSGCQYYATNNLKKHYRSSKLRQPGEMMVSGETGLPLMDKCTQSSNGSNDYAIEDHATPADPSGRLADDRYSEADRTMELSESDQFNSVDSHSQGSQFDAPLEGEEDSQHHTHSSVDNGQLKTESTEMEDQEQVTTPSDVISIKTEPGLDMPESLDSNNSMITTSGSVPETSTPSTPPRVPMSGSSVQRYAVPISPKPYPCSICQKTFRSIQILQKHTLMFHSRPKGHAPLTKVRGKLWGKGHGAQYFNRQPPQEDLLPQEYHCVICNHSFSTTDSLQNHVTQAHMGCATPQESPSTHTNILAAPQELSTSHMETMAMATSQQETPTSLTSLQANQASCDNLTPSLIQTTASSELMQTGGAEQPHSAHSSSILDMAGTASSLHHIFPNTLNMSQSNSPISFSLSGASTSSSLTSSPRRRGNASRTGKLRTLSRSYSVEDLDWKMKKTNNRNIMVALLMTAGPISSPSCINHAGPVFLRNIHKPQFIEAATNLQILGIGSLVRITSLSNGPHVFIKKPPSEVKDALEANKDILDCRFEYYEQRFNMPIPGYCVSSNIRTALVQLGYIST